MQQLLSTVLSALLKLLGGNKHPALAKWILLAIVATLAVALAWTLAGCSWSIALDGRKLEGILKVLPPTSCPAG